VSVHASAEKKPFPLDSAENESKTVLVRITTPGDKVSRYPDVVSESSADKGRTALAVLLAGVDGASLPGGI